MSSRIKRHLLFCSLLCCMILTACSVEVTQPAPTATLIPTEDHPATSSPSVFPTTQVPVTWADLQLSGKLVYLSSTTEGDTRTGTVQMLDLGTGEIATVFSIQNGWIYYATVSPDAKWLIISYTPPAQGDSPSERGLYVLPLDGTGPPQPLFAPPTPNDHLTQAEWAPDGKRVYYVHYTHNDSGGSISDDYDISLMNYPDGTPEKIIDHGFWPRLSADSSRLVYVSLDPASGKNELFLANADGSSPRNVSISGPVTPEIIDAPLFSPDGQSILFSAPSPGQSYQPNWFEKVMGIQIARAHNYPSDWWSVPLTGGTATQLTHIQETGLFASLSPDGKHLSSLSAEGIFVMDLDGSNLTQLISDPQVHGTVSWIP